MRGPTATIRDVLALAVVLTTCDCDRDDGTVPRPKANASGAAKGISPPVSAASTGPLGTLTLDSPIDSKESLSP
jgi:hypothetical protein